MLPALLADDAPLQQRRRLFTASCSYQPTLCGCRCPLSDRGSNTGRARCDGKWVISQDRAGGRGMTGWCRHATPVAGSAAPVLLVSRPQDAITLAGQVTPLVPAVLPQRQRANSWLLQTSTQPAAPLDSRHGAGVGRRPSAAIGTQLRLGQPALDVRESAQHLGQDACGRQLFAPPPGNIAAALATRSISLVDVHHRLFAISAGCRLGRTSATLALPDALLVLLLDLFVEADCLAQNTCAIAGPAIAAAILTEFNLRRSGFQRRRTWPRPAIHRSVCCPRALRLWLVCASYTDLANVFSLTATTQQPTY